MINKRDSVLSMLDDDDALIAWFVELARQTPDVYLRPKAAVSPATLLRDGLGLDSIGRVCVFYAITDSLGLSGEESAVAQWRSVGDVLAFVRASLRGAR